MNGTNQNKTNENKNIIDDIILEILATVFIVGIIIACFWIIF